MNNASVTKKTIRGLSFQTLVTIVLGLVEIGAFSIMSRLLSQQDFGYYAAIVAVATVFQSLSETGIGSAIVQKKNIDQHFIDNAFSLSVILGVIISGSLCLCSNLLARFIADETMTVPLRIFSITLLCQCISSVNISLLQRKLQFLKIGLINLISLILTTIIAIFLAIRGYGYYAILTKAVAQNVFILMASYLVVNIRYKFRYDQTTYKNILGFGGWLMASALFRNLAHQVDRLLMGSLFSVAILGLYTRPKEFISSISNKFNFIFDSVLFPVLSTIQDEKERLQKSFLSSFYFFNLFGMLISLLFFYNGELIIRIFFGENWLKDIKNLFMVLSIYPVFLINGRLGDIFLRSLALTKQQFIFRVGQFSFAVIFILVGYRFGIIALAVSVMLSYLVITSIKIVYLTRKMEISILNIVKIIIKSYKFCLFVIPTYIASVVMLPHSWVGNLIQIIIFVIVIGMLFLAFPKLVGRQYEQEAYTKVVSFVKKKVK